MFILQYHPSKFKTITIQKASHQNSCNVWIFNCCCHPFLIIYLLVYVKLVHVCPRRYKYFHLHRFWQKSQQLNLQHQTYHLGHRTVRNRRGKEYLYIVFLFYITPLQVYNIQLFKGQRVFRIIDVADQLKYLQLIERVLNRVIILLLFSPFQLGFWKSVCLIYLWRRVLQLHFYLYYYLAYLIIRVQNIEFKNMFESKVSTVKSVWGQFSSINTSNAPGFIPIPCPTHQEYSITNICKSPGCIEPLCPQCITTHVQLHQQTKKTAKIQNIISTRVTVIEQLAKLKYEGQKQLQENLKSGSGNIEQYIQAQQKKIDIAEKKVVKAVQQIFEEMRKNMDIISSAYFQQKQKKQKQCKIKTAPLADYVQRVNSYKQQLQSEDYIPALIELLNQPPKRPKVQDISKIENYGSVQINQKYLQELKSDLKKFVKVQVNCKDEGKMNLGRSNYHSSNNMKFSRFDRSRSNEGAQSRMRRSTSKSKIFGRNQSIVSSRVQVPQNLKSLTFSNYEKGIELNKNNYFHQEGSITYFRENSRNYLQANLNYVEAGFDKFQLQINFFIPSNHRTIITPSQDIFMIGGQRPQKISNKMYMLEQKYYLTQYPSMHEQRSQFGACFHSNAIYVFGGLKNTSGYSRVLTNGCERYFLKEKKWEKIRPMNEATYNFEVCSFNEKIIKFGGTTENGRILSTIDIYYPQVNEWKILETHDKVELNSKIGAVQTSNNSLVIFGGYTGRGQKSSKCYTIYESNGLLQIYMGTQLYNQATFETSFIHKNSIYALQDGQANRSKLIMSYRNEQWKFISC